MLRASLATDLPSHIQHALAHGIIVNYTGKIVILRIVSGFHCISSFHHNMWHKKRWLLPKWFTSLLLVVASASGSYLAGRLVCFSFVVAIQWQRSSEVKDIGGSKRIF